MAKANWAFCPVNPQSLTSRLFEDFKKVKGEPFLFRLPNFSQIFLQIVKIVKINILIYKII